MAHGRRGRRSYAKASSPDSTSSILDAIAVGATQMPAMDTYWLLYQKCVWVAACVNLIANTIAGDGFSITAKRGQENDVDDERRPQIDEFFDNGFTGKITYRRAMFALTVDILVFGVAYWRKKRAGRLCIGLERVDPRYVLPKPNADRTEIDHFIIRRKQRMGDDIANTVIGAPIFANGDNVPPKDMVFFTLGGGDQLIGAPSPLEHLDHTLGLDLAIRKFRQSFFNNGATFGMILANDEADREQVRAAEEMIRTRKRGAQNAFSTSILSGKWTIMSKGEKSGDKDVDFAKGSAINREEICAIYHVPVGKLTFSGNALGSSGKAEDDQTFQSQCVLPLEEAIFEVINRDVLDAEFGIKDIGLAPQRRAAVRYDMLDAATKAVQIGATGNEARVMANLPPIADERYQMDIPLFLGAKGQSLAAEEPIAPAATPTDATGDITDANDNNDEVAAAAKARFRCYP